MTEIESDKKVLSFHRLLYSSTIHPVFQLTTSRGGRLLEAGHALQQEYFNSRPHEEVDRRFSRRSSMKIFQLTTSRGGRRNFDPLDQPSSVFQLTTSRGGRHRFFLPGSSGGCISTHALTRRSTPLNSDVSYVSFISTHDLTVFCQALFTKKSVRIPCF